VAKFLDEAGAEARIEEFPAGTPTAKDAAEAVGCALGAIVKSLVFTADARSVLVLVPGDRRADGGKVAEAVGTPKVRIAGPDEVERATGFAPGAVSPFALAQVDTVLIDRTLLTRDVVWVGAGSDRHMAGVEPAELVRLTRAAAIDAVGVGA
jgi:Cys-tRNA(Pro) deacylase